MKDICEKKIRMMEPNSIIANDYIRKAEEALKNMEITPSIEWKVVSAYYACYNALYAILQRTGINCENHDCTIKLMASLDFTQEKITFMKELKTQRINAQYYVNRPYKLAEQNKVKQFVLECKKTIITTNIKQIREKIKKSQNLSTTKSSCVRKQRV